MSDVGTLALLEFLTAMVDADEAAALDAAGWGLSGRERSPGTWHRDGVSSVVDTDQRLVVYGDGPSPGEAEAEHIVRWNPARVLREVEAKRRIIAEAQPIVETDGWEYDDAPDFARTVLRLLALPYVDHPQFREEWRL